MSKLIWAKYESNDKKQKHFLLLELGVYNGLFCCLATDSLTSDEIAVIRSNADELEKLEPVERVELLKKICPKCIKAYRTLRPERMEIINTYPIKKL